MREHGPLMVVYSFDSATTLLVTAAYSNQPICGGIAPLGCPLFSVPPHLCRKVVSEVVALFGRLISAPQSTKEDGFP